jgi:hypothetical protein
MQHVSLTPRAGWTPAGRAPPLLVFHAPRLASLRFRDMLQLLRLDDLPPMVASLDFELRDADVRFAPAETRTREAEGGERNFLAGFDIAATAELLGLEAVPVRLYKPQATASDVRTLMRPTYVLEVELNGGATRYSDAKQRRIVTFGISGGRSLTGPLRDAHRFPST